MYSTYTFRCYLGGDDSSAGRVVSNPFHLCSGRILCGGRVGPWSLAESTVLYI